MQGEPVKRINKPTVRKNSKIDTGKALVSYLNNPNYSEIARQSGTTREAVRQRLKPLLKTLLNKEELADYRKKEVDLLDSAKAKFLVAALDTKKLKKATTQQCVWSFGVLTDKSLLLQGKATQIIENKSLVLQATQTLADIRERLDSAQIIDSESESVLDQKPDDVDNSAKQLI